MDKKTTIIYEKRFSWLIQNVPTGRIGRESKAINSLLLQEKRGWPDKNSNAGKPKIYFGNANVDFVFVNIIK